MRPNFRSVAIALLLGMPAKALAGGLPPATVSPNVMIANLPGDNMPPAPPNVLPQAVRNTPLAPFVAAFPAIPDSKINGPAKVSGSFGSGGDAVSASDVSKAICDSLIVDGAKPAKPGQLNFGCKLDEFAPRTN